MRLPSLFRSSCNMTHYKREVWSPLTELKKNSRSLFCLPYHTSRCCWFCMYWFVSCVHMRRAVYIYVNALIYVHNVIPLCLCSLISCQNCTALERLYGNTNNMMWGLWIGEKTQLLAYCFVCLHSSAPNNPPNLKWDWYKLIFCLVKYCLFFHEKNLLLCPTMFWLL